MSDESRNCSRVLCCGIDKESFVIRYVHLFIKFKITYLSVFRKYKIDEWVYKDVNSYSAAY
jgi:hypothetical protein